VAIDSHRGNGRRKRRFPLRILPTGFPAALETFLGNYASFEGKPADFSEDSVFYFRLFFLRFNHLASLNRCEALPYPQEREDRFVWE
jgi:hypothetical protein